ncbi:hypothetical protein I316_07626 [Kwoniella heveanensis BCC8398]|uniref:Uncharacterized protein n=1 Tax=Kwoniella heveanensis BCC8398 TaxID=1296120 RepID=A0A1B9GI49_9TREE|nr:hypothetical protein I316_07626 [Kwoniella heveanensis BCC8398]
MAHSECEQIPSVTLYGTTQLTSTITTHALITSIIRLDPTVSAGETITPSSASILSSQVITRTVVTSLVPQQTLYSPCPGDGDGDTTATGVAGAQAQATKSVARTPGQVQGEETDDPQATGQFTGVIPSYQSIKGSSTALALSSYNATLTKSQAASTNHAPSSATVVPTDASSSVSADSDGTSDSASSGSSSTSSNDLGPIVGGVLGGVISLVVLVAFAVCIKRKNQRRKNRRERYIEGEEGEGGHDGNGDYWERRFRQLEAEGEKRVSGETGDGDGALQGHKGEEEMTHHKKLHLTLNLASKDLPSRPASRLSAISSFFATRFNPSAMVTQSPSKRSTTLPMPPKSSMESTRLVKPRPSMALRSYSNDDLRSVRSGSLSHKSGLSFSGQNGQTGSGSKSPGANKLSLFFLPSMREERQMVPLQDPPSAATSRPGSSLSLSINTSMRPTPSVAPGPAMSSGTAGIGQPRPSVERGQFSPTDSEIEERRNMEWIRHSTTTAKSRESEKYAGMGRDQLNSYFSGRGLGPGGGSGNRGFLTASALRRISGMSPSKLGETPPKRGVLAGVGVGAGHSKTNHPPSITSSVLPNLTQQSRAMESELTPADSISVYDTEIELENAPSESTFTLSTYSTHPSFGLSRPQSKRDSHKTLTMYKSERGSGPPSAPASAAGSRPTSKLAPGPSIAGVNTGDPRPLSSARRSLYPPRRTPSGRIISMHSQPRSEHSASGSNPASPPPIPTRVVSGTPIPPMQPHAQGARASRSMREIRMSKGKHVPELRLSRRAITPSLWIDEEALARFADAPSGKSALSKIPSERAVDSPARQTFNVDKVKEDLIIRARDKENRDEGMSKDDRRSASTSKRGHNREGAAAANLESRFSDDTSESSTRLSRSASTAKGPSPRSGIEIKLEPDPDPDPSLAGEEEAEADEDEEDPYGGIHVMTSKSPKSTKASKIDKGKGKVWVLSIPVPSAPVSPFSSAHPSPSSRRETGDDVDSSAIKSLQGKSRDANLEDAKPRDIEGAKINKRESAISLSPTRSWASGSSATTGTSTTISTEEAPIAKVDKNERSAVTPQLPVLALSSAGLGGWSVGGHGDARADDDDDGEERIKSPSPPE